MPDSTSVLSLVDAFSMASDAIVGVAALAAVVIAFLGLQAWRRELHGKEDYHLARRLVRAAYKVRDAFRHVRHPFMWGEEFPDEIDGKPYNSLHADQETRYKASVYAYERRWTRLNEAMRELEADGLEAQVLWGTEFDKLIDPFRYSRMDLQDALNIHLREIRGDRRAAELDEKRNASRTIFASGKLEDDEFARKVEAAIAEIEKVAGKHLGSRKLAAK